MGECQHNGSRHWFVRWSGISTGSGVFLCCMTLVRIEGRKHHEPDSTGQRGSREYLSLSPK